MPTHPFLTLGFSVALSVACLLGLRLGLAEEFYGQIERVKFGSSIRWWWLRVFNIPVTKENCVRLIKISIYIFMMFWLVFAALNVAFNG